jgi:hypothetical protein
MLQRSTIIVLILVLAGGCNSRTSDANSARSSGVQTAPQSPTSLLAAIARELKAYNPRLDKFAILDLRVVNAEQGIGYVTIGYGRRNVRDNTRDMRDEAFGVFAINDSLTRVWKTFEIMPTKVWHDWGLKFQDVGAQFVDVIGGRNGFTSDTLTRRYVWPCARYSDPPQPGEDTTTKSCTTNSLSSGTWDPTDPDGNFSDRHSRFDIGAEHFLSGRLVLTLDTISPRVITEGATATRTLTDSLVVTGIGYKESWSRTCTRAGRYDGLVLGVIPNTVTTPTVPRLAWQFDTVRYRIRAIPTDSILCAVNTPD